MFQNERVTAYGKMTSDRLESHITNKKRPIDEMNTIVVPNDRSIVNKLKNKVVKFKNRPK